MKLSTFASGVIVICILFSLSSETAFSTEEYARATGKQCDFCHLDPSGGGELNQDGRNFQVSLDKGRSGRSAGGLSRQARFVAGFFHITFAILWFGTILYVHILLKPAYAARGLPKGELFVGWLSIVVISISGAILTSFRVRSLDTLLHTKFGLLLLLKVSIFLLMVTTAFVVTFLIGPRMKRKKLLQVAEGKHDLTLDELAQFDGKERRKAFVGFRGKIYDVSSSRMWEMGDHLQKHHAGFDLTDALKGAPHEDDRVLEMPLVGTILHTRGEVDKPVHLRLFYFFAYLNLFFVITIILIVAVMRWW